MLLQQPRLVKTASSVLARAKELIHKGDVRKVNSLLEDELNRTPDDAAHPEVAALLHEFCKDTTNRDSTLPTGIKPSLLEEMGVPLVILPENSNPHEQLRIITRIVCAIKGLDIKELQGLTDKTLEATGIYGDWKRLRHTTPFLYGEPSETGKQRADQMDIGTNGRVTLHWVEDKTRYEGGWLSNVHIEVASHATDESNARHWALVASLQLKDNGKVIGMVPAIGSSEGGDNYGIRNTACICALLN